MSQSNDFILYKRDISIAYLLRLLILLGIHKPRYNLGQLEDNINWLEVSDTPDHRTHLHWGP